MVWLPLIFWVLLVLACLPACARLMLPPVPPDDERDAPECVLVLGGGRKFYRQGVVLSTRSLVRLEAGLGLAQRERLPLLVSGGVAQGLAGASEAELMANAVRQRQPQQEVWCEMGSRTTYENACLSAVELRRRGIDRVYVVTDRTHLCRAILCLRKQGISALPHASDLFPQPDWLPHAGALSLWPELAYEWLALGWYVCRRWV